MFKVILNHLFRYVACTPTSISDSPEMPTPIPFLQLGKFLLQVMGTTPFKIFTFSELHTLIIIFLSVSGYCLQEHDNDIWQPKPGGCLTTDIMLQWNCRVLTIRLILNRRQRKKLNFENPKNVFFHKIALASWIYAFYIFLSPTLKPIFLFITFAR